MAIAAVPITATPSEVRQARARTAPWQLVVLADSSIVAMATLVLPVQLWVPFSAILVASLASLGCYRPRFTGQLGANISRIVASVAVAVVATGVFSSAEHAILLMRVAPFAAAGLLATRSLASIAVRMVRRRTLGEPALIVGAGAVGARLAANLLDHPEIGLLPVGVVDDVADGDLALPLLGGTSDLASVVHAFDVRHIVVAFGLADEQRMVEVLRTCERLDADVWVVPRLFELGATADVFDELWGTPISKLNRAALNTWQWSLKRAFDIVVSAVTLTITAPVLLFIVAAIKLTSPGPIFFRQLRVGQRGRPIEVLKFRTMTVNDDSDETWTVTDDPRVTPIGRLLRPTSLDELPQLINVLRGDMSLVGPRPERPHFVEQFSERVPGYDHRHRVPVGLTGLAQVNGLRGDTSIEERAVFDNRYIESWSLWSDIVILARTVWAVLRPPTSVRIATPESDGASSSTAA